MLTTSPVTRRAAPTCTGSASPAASSGFPAGLAGASIGVGGGAGAAKSIPLGMADVKRAGTDVTLVAHAKMVNVALKAADGSTNWSNAAALEIAGVFGAAAPSIGQGTVVAGFSSGELNAYRYENGRQVWQDALARTSITTSVAP